MNRENEILKVEKVGEESSAQPFNPLTLKPFNHTAPLTLKPFNLNSEEARLLLNIALMAIGGNRFRSAAKILAVLEQFRPNHPSVAVAKTVALMSAGEFEAAVAYVDSEALRKFPDSAMLKAFKGMALMRLGRKNVAKVSLEEAARATDDPAAAKMAGDLLKG